MSSKITTAGVHHIRLIVTEPIRSRDFYTSLLNFMVTAELSPGFVLTNGNTLLTITPQLDASQAPPNDRFSPNRAELNKAAALLEEHGVEHGEVYAYPSSGTTLLRFSEPDGI